MTYVEALNWGKRQLSEAQVAEAELDAWYLLEYVTGMNRANYFLQQQDAMKQVDYTSYQQLICQRKERIPLQYLTGTQEFMGLTFQVSEDVLIPRQDTEILVELALPEVKGKRVLDVCTGSGCIAISLQKLGEPAVCHGVDLSLRALAVADRNRKQLQADVTLWQSDLFSQVTETYDVIVSNPPYIPPMVIRNLMPEVREHEPRMALDGGEDGLDFYRRLASEAGLYLREGGRIYLEIGHDQGADVSALLEGQGFCDVVIHRDLAGLDRVVCAKWQKSLEGKKE